LAQRTDVAHADCNWQDAFTYGGEIDLGSLRKIVCARRTAPSAARWDAVVTPFGRNLSDTLGRIAGVVFLSGHGDGARARQLTCRLRWSD